VYSSIILIGPIRAGKTVIAELLAGKLGMPQVSLDDVRWEYYSEVGYDEAEVSRLAKSDDGMLAILDYWKPFEAYSVERVLADYPDAVIDFGAGHSVYEDAALFARVQHALAQYPNVVLLLPSPDPDESATILNERFSRLLAEELGEVDPRLLDVNAQFVRHPSNFTLAKIVVYTNNKTPDETCDEIIRQISAKE
jgi:hypothetical protein